MSATPSSAPDNSAEFAARQKRGRTQLLIIFAMFGVPLLLATIWLHMVRSSGGALGDTSRGELISPAVPLTEFELPSTQLRTDGDVQGTFALDDIRGLWTLLYVVDKPCGEVCERNLYHMRQVRLALNHRMDRVQRVVMLDAPDRLTANVQEAHPGVHLLDTSATAEGGLSEQVDAALEGMEPLDNAVYLVDPMGNLMMRFAPDLPPKSMLKDIKHLLKVSRIG